MSSTGKLHSLTLAIFATAATLLASAVHGAESSNGNALPLKDKPSYVCPADPDGVVFATPGFCGHDERIKKGSGLRVAVLLFEGAQLIDFTGPMEIFGQAGATVFTVAPTKAERTSTFGLKITPDYDFADAPPADVLLVPGGNVNEIVRDSENRAWVVKQAQESQIVLSVCTGAFILGRVGLLDGLPATTFADQIKNLKKNFPGMTEAVSNRRYVDTGKIITTAGLSAGIDGALHVIDRWYGRFDAVDLARGMEYDWVPDRKGSFGELVVNKMPHWPAVVPKGSAWERFSERGDGNHWETRAHVGFDSTPESYLASFSQGALKEDWRQTGEKRLSRTFVRTEGGQLWKMTASLAKANVAEGYDLSVSIVKAKPRSAPR